MYLSHVYLHTPLCFLYLPTAYTCKFLDIDTKGLVSSLVSILDSTIAHIDSWPATTSVFIFRVSSISVRNVSLSDTGSSIGMAIDQTTSFEIIDSIVRKTETGLSFTSK
jgi:hypothetical protein